MKREISHRIVKLINIQLVIPNFEVTLNSFVLSGSYRILLRQNFNNQNGNNSDNLNSHI